MKKSAAICMIFVFLLSMCACGLTVTEQQNTTASSSSAETTTAGTHAAEPSSLPPETSSLSHAAQELPSGSTSGEKSTTTAVTSGTTARKQDAAKTTPAKTKRSTTSDARTTVKTTKTTKATKTTKKQITCTVEISCKSILQNREKLKSEKREFVPASGVILEPVTVSLPAGGTAFDAIKSACANNLCSERCSFCRKNHIQLEYVYTPGYDSYYIRGIHQLYEKDCGSQSGWMYCVNGVFPNRGCSQYTVSSGDVIRFLYTCDLGEDVGNHY